MTLGCLLWEPRVLVGHCVYDSEEESLRRCSRRANATVIREVAQETEAVGAGRGGPIAVWLEGPGKMGSATPEAGA